MEKQGIFRLPEISLGIARHIEKAYDYLNERVTQWVSIKKRSDLYKEVEHYQAWDPMALADFVLKLGDMAESFGDCQEFRVWACIMGREENDSHGTQKRANYP